MKTKEQIEAEFDLSITNLKIAALAAEQEIVTQSTCRSLLYAARVVLAMSNEPGFKAKTVAEILARQQAASFQGEPLQAGSTQTAAPVIDLFGHKSGGKA